MSFSMDASVNALEMLYLTYPRGEQPFVKSMQILTGNQQFIAGPSLHGIYLSWSTNVRILVSMGCTMINCSPNTASSLPKHALLIVVPFILSKVAALHWEKSGIQADPISGSCCRAREQRKSVRIV